MPSSVLCPFIETNMIRRQLLKCRHHSSLNQQSTAVPGDLLNVHVTITLPDSAVTIV